MTTFERCGIFPRLIVANNGRGCPLRRESFILCVCCQAHIYGSDLKLISSSFWYFLMAAMWGPVRCGGKKVGI